MSTGSAGTSPARRRKVLIPTLVILAVLVGAFVIGPVADDRAKAGAGDRRHVGEGDLRADRQLAGEGSNVHVVCLQVWGHCSGRWGGSEEPVPQRG